MSVEMQGHLRRLHHVPRRYWAGQAPHWRRSTARNVPTHAIYLCQKQGNKVTIAILDEAFEPAVRSNLMNESLTSSSNTDMYAHEDVLEQAARSLEHAEAQQVAAYSANQHSHLSLFRLWRWQMDIMALVSGQFSAS